MEIPEELSPKRKLFCQEYLVDLNAAGAYKRAGYTVKNDNVARVEAHKLLYLPVIAEYIQSMMDKRSKNLAINANYVLSTIVETIERCKQVRPVLHKNGDQVMVETPDGEIAPAYTFEPNAVLKGAELLGKHLKMFTDKAEIEHSGNLTVEITRFGLDK